MGTRWLTVLQVLPNEQVIFYDPLSSGLSFFLFLSPGPFLISPHQISF